MRQLDQSSVERGDGIGQWVVERQAIEDVHIMLSAWESINLLHKYN